MNKNFRYKLVPQMKAYDNLGYQWLPFLMFNQSFNFRSKEINTDNKGFRFNLEFQNYPKSIFEINNEKQNIIILGSSFGFGVGSTNDANSISGHLEKKNKNYNFLNLSGRAHVGIQEILSLILNINEIKNVKRIIILSGVNDLHISNFQNTTYPDLFYFKSLFVNQMEKSQLPYKKRIFKNLFNLFSSNNLTFDALKKINKSNLFRFLSSSEFRHDIINVKKDNISFEKKIDRNIKLYKILGDYYKCDISFYLQPVNNWCKDGNDEETQLYEYSKKYFTKFNKHLDETYSYNNYEKYKKFYFEQSNKNNINFFDINDYFKQKTSKKDWIFVDRVHCNDKGYELAAEFINK